MPPSKTPTPDANFPPYTFAQATTPTNDDHIKEDTPAPFVQMDFDTDFDGMRFRALAGMRYEKSTVTAKVCRRCRPPFTGTIPTEFVTNLCAQRDVQRRHELL